MIDDDTSVKNRPAKKIGLRQVKKLEKERRIKEAARALFIEKGYENATIRQITKRADVGIGTIFRYAANKRDLLFFIYNDMRADFRSQSVDDIPSDISLIAQLEQFFGHLIEFFATQPELARDILRETALYDSGLQMERYWRTRHAAEHQLTHLLKRNQEAGRIALDTDVKLLTILLFDIYRSALRRWVMKDGKDVQNGLAMVVPLFQIALKGVVARDEEL
ncbi:TetR/AcrR family transcriptional regulator [Pararhizobium sp. IMCC21322]|uniref:TetR/AcrR family transcriptional regulator n=1 Tax=Pararhizobium sp. IMCC21322 TaxID=3067903 RepID=UPI002740445C|nr:TetR/AcrR family transcriptional regulator [Pararhizobium sp. IMCC21322]